MSIHLPPNKFGSRLLDRKKVKLSLNEDELTLHLERLVKVGDLFSPRPNKWKCI